ncbi:hypothetical protein SteCoe_32961 [Stentor coeruleus]|uniref:Uncharacterized protein n=1 Tax=Stentor coeruleus TaxID=5963 RepID=A0A1R2AY00_9CILI|nr:hypothetical protein SteCoe_32961 [Stentor coeruleus]
MEDSLMFNQKIFSLCRLSVFIEYVKIISAGMLLIYKGIEKSFDFFFIHNFIMLALFFPLCLYGILSYIALDNLLEEFQKVKKYFLVKKIIAFIWICEWMMTILCIWLLNSPLNQVIVPSVFIGFGILTELFFLYALKICVNKNDVQVIPRKNTLSGVHLDVIPSEIAHNTSAVFVVVATEVIEKNGAADLNATQELEKTEAILAHDYTVEKDNNA